MLIPKRFFPYSVVLIPPKGIGEDSNEKVIFLDYMCVCRCLSWAHTEYFLSSRRTGFGDIIGYVTDSANSQPVPFAEITYTLSIPAGTYDLAVGKTGYESKTVASIALVTSGQAKLDFALTPLVGPVAVLSVVPAVTPVGTSVTLDARGSYHPEGEIVSYEWDLDNDGEWDDALGPTSSCSYERPGTFRVGLRVTDRNELVDTDEQEVIVTPLNSIPELPWGSILASTTMILAIVSYLTIPRFRKHVRRS